MWRKRQKKRKKKWPDTCAFVRVLYRKQLVHVFVSVSASDIADKFLFSFSFHFNVRIT